MVSDDEFLRVWRELHSAQRVAERLGMSVRNVHVIRRRVEKRQRVVLSADARHSQHSSRVRAEVGSSIVRVNLADGVVVVAGDAHYWPGPPTTAHLALLKLIRQLKPALVVLNGDLFDGASMSRHPRIGWETPPLATDELAACQLRISEIGRVARGARKIWNLGNHDLRFDSRLSAVVAVAEGVPGFSLREHFPNWEFAMRVDLNNDAVIKHRFRGGIHATYNNTLHAGKSLISGHLHSQRVTPFTDYRGSRYGVDAGCLADPTGDQFAYAEANPTNWRAGFAVLTVAESRLMPPELVEVIGEGRVWFRWQAIEV